ncbi:EIIAB-Man [Serratia fonticola]|uniref:PTS sugar transporter subunit IIA n=1 Tax=Serratia fonticola TaxID=47917 RepID=UPI0021831344|nr:PTS N-acetylgalactosamine transporter subunit IIA [Serratia fonticola]CAI2161203.1 EIIAB-Man [Serratia fonticola]
MKVAIVISSNGLISRELLNVAEYTIGCIGNALSIGFHPDESLEALFVRYKTALQELDVRNGILFLVESGSSCHQFVASCLAREYPGSHIVTGVNLPMLLSLFVSEINETNSMLLASRALEYGKEAISIVQERKMEQLAEACEAKNTTVEFVV